MFDRKQLAVIDQTLLLLTELINKVDQGIKLSMEHIWSKNSSFQLVTRLPPNLVTQIIVPVSLCIRFS
jgi:hypothetical protein